MPTVTQPRAVSRPARRGPRQRRPTPRFPVWLVVAIVVVLGAVAIAVAVTRSSGRKAASIPVGCQVPAVSSPGNFRLAPGQAQNASVIAAVAFKLGLPDHAVTVGLATALRESQLENLTHGDRDSLGLFQQRPSEGWGTAAQILDPVYAATVFYQHLEQVPDWQTIPVTDAAQAVQHSATPLAYASYEDEARALAAALTGETPAVFGCRLNGFAGVAPAPSALQAAAVQEMGSDMLGVPASNQKAGWALASWTVGHAWAYHLQAVIFGSWRWTATSGRWVNIPQASTTTAAVQVQYAN